MDSKNWKKELLDSQIFNKKESNLLKNGAKSLTDSWWLQALYVRWKKLKGYEDPNIEKNVNFNHHLRNLKEKIKIEI